jgi:glycosyltransferase involved in cell wall biosynthesis
VSSRPLSITQVSATEHGGGAETVARQLHHCFRARGHDAALLVGRGRATGPDVHAFGEGRHAGLRHLLAGPLRIIDRQRGLETYRYPRSRRMIDAAGAPDVVHLHNLHGGYFDLGQLPELSRRLPVVLTLHDAWLLSGHCAHSFDCERWRTGCGACPDLTIYPAIRRDATAMNWQRKRDIFARSRLHVAAPSEWLADRVRESMMAPALAELRVIPNGVDLDVFRPGDRQAARSALGIPAHADVLLVVGSRNNRFKDFELALDAAERAATLADREITMIAVGDAAPDAQHGRVRVRSVPFVHDTGDMVGWYHAADIYVHAARADTFPTAVLEALACGLPVVATAVGGIPEQVRPLASTGATVGTAGAATGTVAATTGAVATPTGAAAAATGVLTPAGDAAAMAIALARLLADAALRQQLGDSAARDAARRFDLRRQCDVYLDWYRSIVVAERG